ncbi:MAG TPA: hypothetical protein VMS17_04310, partial [Gemmataceae bacterium]|nr:hypothetical protein [Gemmataceae bacterium]
MLLARMAGVIAAIFGVFFLLYIFAMCTLVPPGLIGIDWWTKVLGKMVSQTAISGTVVGVVCVMGGIILLFVPAGRCTRIAAAIAIGALAVLIVAA